MREPSFELHSKVDEDGFVAVVCPDEYSGYVGEDWTLQQMLSRFTEQMNNGTLFAVCLGPNLADLPLRIADAPSKLNAQREVSGFLRVHHGGAWLTDYGQLTMAAQFSDERPLRQFHIRLPLSPGEYWATFRQFARSHEDHVEPAAELVISAAEPGDSPSKFDAFPWFG
ncbi:hypothetical protein FOB72_23490 [Cupriavidus pauculus]|jgi:hypothetical protein|uniref:Uncharacterized protein n=1 Tax=Cupriavidus pauculus TaxID=82633 RepID=A0A5P2HBP7_9BURK|nr:hypothetical protein [Cupriavidus pauculus]QET05024.1 hypothetical protein FOB72_23490 [Cupriavidus pauculus]